MSTVSVSVNIFGQALICYYDDHRRTENERFSSVVSGLHNTTAVLS